MHLDVVDEVLGGNLEKFAEIVEPLSDTVKVGYIPSPEEQEVQDSNDFALVLFHPHVGTLNKYAMYTSELTELNLAYLAEKQAQLPDELLKTAATNLSVAARKFNITVPESLEEFIADKKYIDNVVDVRNISELDYINKTEKLAEITEYAWPEEQRYPLGDSSNIQKAAAYFDRYHSEMHSGKKLEFAVNTTISAGKHDVSLEGTEVEKYAALSRDLFNPDFYEHIEIRQSYLSDNDEESREAYKTLIDKCDEYGPVKTAEALYELDKEADLTRSYGSGIEDAIMATLQAPIEAVKSIDGTLVKKSSLEGISSEDLTSLVGNDVITELKGEDGLDVLNSLPKPIRDEIISKIG